MKLPPFFIAASLLFWGIESDRLVIAFILALAAEGHQLYPRKLILTDNDFIRLSDLSSILFLATIALILLNQPSAYFFATAVSWMPVIIAPLLLGQLYSRADSISIGTRFGSKKIRSYRHRPMDIRSYYCGGCVFGGAAANSGSQLFYPLLVLLVGWFLFVNRGKSYRISTWGILFILSASLGYGGSLLVEKSHYYLQAQSRSLWRSYYHARHSDPFRTQIAYGTLGKLKLSGNIVLRVKGNRKVAPGRLYQSSFNWYRNNTWYAQKRPFTVPVYGRNGSSWDLQPGTLSPQNILHIEQNLPREKGILVRPPGTTQLRAANLFELQRNIPGTLKAVDCAPVVESSFSYTKARNFADDIPDANNMEIPEEERTAIAAIGKGLFNPGANAEKNIAAIERFFAGFSYTLDLQDRGEAATVLANFLTNTQRGHCELFATATTLLLRQAGIPSRYVTGFSVTQYSWLEQCYLGRERDAHSWSEYYLNGAWHTLDTTPSIWREADRRHSIVEPLLDLYRYFIQKYRKFKISGPGDITVELSIALVMLVMLLIFRIYRKMQAKKEQLGLQELFRSFDPVDSPFYNLVSTLEAAWESPMGNCPFPEYLTQMEERAQLDQARKEELLSMYSLHLKLRFDTENFSLKEMDELCQGTARFIDLYANDDG